MEAIITEKECPKCNVGAMTFVLCRVNAFNSNLIMEISLFRCGNCGYTDEIASNRVGNLTR